MSGVASADPDALDGFAVAGEAASGEEAVELARQLRPVLVLMDIKLPGIDGIEATRRVLAEAPATAVVLCSTYLPSDLPDGATDCGAAGYVRKDGYQAIPVLIVLDGAGEELGHLVERPARVNEELSAETRRFARENAHLDGVSRRLMVRCLAEFLAGSTPARHRVIVMVCHQGLAPEEDIYYARIIVE